jgi:hypothetical protein
MFSTAARRRIHCGLEFGHRHSPYGNPRWSCIAADAPRVNSLIAVRDDDDQHARMLCSSSCWICLASQHYDEQPAECDRLLSLFALTSLWTLSNLPAAAALDPWNMDIDCQAQMTPG